MGGCLMKIAVRILSGISIFFSLLLAAFFIGANVYLAKQYDTLMEKYGDSTIQEALDNEDVPGIIKEILANPDVQKVSNESGDNSVKIVDLHLDVLFKVFFIIMTVLCFASMIWEILNFVFIGFTNKIFLIIWGVVNIFVSLLIGILFIVKGATQTEQQQS